MSILMPGFKTLQVYCVFARSYISITIFFIKICNADSAWIRGQTFDNNAEVATFKTLAHNLLSFGRCSASIPPLTPQQLYNISFVRQKLFCLLAAALQLPMTPLCLCFSPIWDQY